MALNKWSDEQLRAKAKDEFDNKNYQKSYRYLFQLAKNDDPEALYALGYLYYYGNGVKKNLNMSQDLIRQSAALGYKPAIRALRTLLANKVILNADTKNKEYFASSTKSSSTSSSIEKIKKPEEITKIAKSDNTTKKSEKTKINHITNPIVKISARKSNTDKEIVISKNTVTEPKLEPKLDTKIKTKHPVIKKTDATTSTTDTKKAHKSDNKYQDLKQKLKNHNTNDIWGEEEKSSHTKEIAKNNTSWLKQQNPENYTIQVATSNSIAEIDDFILNNNLQNKVKTFSYKYKGTQWYGAGYGIYKNPADAYSALLDELPQNINIKKPWVRQFKNIEPELALK